MDMAQLASGVELTLGDFSFSGVELPESITFGGSQNLAVHDLVGGGRVVEALGPKPRALEWRGLLLGPDALTRGLMLDEMRKAGKLLVLTLPPFSMMVVVASLELDFQRPWQLPYRISLEVVSESSPQLLLAPDPSLTELMLQNLKQIVSLSQTLGDSTLSGKVSSLSDLLGSGFSSSQASPGLIEQLKGKFLDMRQYVQGLLAQTTNTIQSVTTLGGILPYNPVAQQAARITGQLNALSAQPDLIHLQGLLGVMSSNLGNAAAGEKTITVVGGSLYDIAVSQYGDANAWTTIARANGLSDPVLEGTFTLIIPSAPDGSGGVLHG